MNERPVSATPVTVGEDVLALEVDLSVFALPAVLRACYKLTDRCFVFIARDREDPRLLVVTLGAKLPELDLRTLAGVLANELIDQQLRENLAGEAGPIRELIVAQAFAEGNLLDPERDEGDYREDPREIGRRR